MTYSGNQCLFVQLFAGRIGRYLKHTVTSTLKRPAAAIPPPKVLVKGSKPPMPHSTAAPVDYGTGRIYRSAKRFNWRVICKRGSYATERSASWGDKTPTTKSWKKNIGSGRRVQGKEVMHVRFDIALCAIAGYYVLFGEQTLCSLLLLSNHQNTNKRYTRWSAS